MSCLEEVERLNSVVEDLLLMARMEGNALSARPTPVNLAQVLEDVAPALSELAKGRKQLHGFSCFSTMDRRL